MNAFILNSYIKPLKGALGEISVMKKSGCLGLCISSFRFYLWRNKELFCGFLNIRIYLPELEAVMLVVIVFWDTW